MSGPVSEPEGMSALAVDAPLRRAAGISEASSSGGHITPRLIDADQAAFWTATAGHRFAGLFSSAPWTRAVARTYGFRISAAVRGAAAAVDAALLFSRVSDLRGDRIVCGPFCDYCDPLAEDAEAWQAIVEPVLAMQLPVTLRCLHNEWPARDPRFTVAGRAAYHSIDLGPRGGGAVERPRRIRPPERAQGAAPGCTIREGRSLDDVRAFFDMHCMVRKAKYRLLPQPFALFEALHEAFAPEDRLVVLLADCAGSVVAGTLYIQWGDTLYYKFNASADRQACPNDLLVWEGIRLGQRRGLRRFDFGASDYAQPGLLRYKRKFAHRGARDPAAPLAAARLRGPARRGGGADIIAPHTAPDRSRRAG